jgi:hypothetical protein
MIQQGLLCLESSDQRAPITVLSGLLCLEVSDNCAFFTDQGPGKITLGVTAGVKNYVEGGLRHTICL